VIPRSSLRPCTDSTGIADGFLILMSSESPFTAFQLTRQALANLNFSIAGRRLLLRPGNCQNVSSMP
jgi:hypothetical protein